MKDITKNLFKEAILSSFKEGFMAGAKAIVEAEHDAKGNDVLKIFDKKMKESFEKHFSKVTLVQAMADSLIDNLTEKSKKSQN